MFTEEEKRTIVSILILIMEADNVIHPKEVEYINCVFDDFGLSSAEFDHMEMIDFNLLKQQFDKLTISKKQIAKKMFLKMAGVDGFVDYREQKIIDEL